MICFVFEAMCYDLCVVMVCLTLIITISTLSKSVSFSQNRIIIYFKVKLKFYILNLVGYKVLVQDDYRLTLLGLDTFPLLYLMVLNVEQLFCDIYSDSLVDKELPYCNHLNCFIDKTFRVTER